MSEEQVLTGLYVFTILFLLFVWWDQRQSKLRMERMDRIPYATPRPTQKDFDTMREECGLLDPDQPTLTAHNEYTRTQQAEFTSFERQMIRYQMGFVPPEAKPTHPPTGEA